MARPERTGARAKRTPKQVALTVLKWTGIAVVALMVLGAATFAVAYARAEVPNPQKDFQTNVTQVFYKDGQTQLGSFAVQNRVSIPLSEMSQHAQDAIVAGENEGFWTDPGISITGLARAVLTAVGPGQTSGGSTITQQYVKVAYLTQEKTVTRKLNEIIIALKVSKDLSKEQILEGYLNTVYFGRGAYGIQTASQAFFDKDAKDLDYPQAIALTAMINDPGRLDPLQGEKQRADLLERYQYTINQLVKTGKITEAQKAEWYDKLPDFPPMKRDARFAGPSGYLLRMVSDELKANGFEDAQINGGGLKIVTTIDKRMQDAAVETAQRETTRVAAVRKQDPAKLHAVIASVDTATGGILASYGGPDYVANNRNWATTPRPTGSTFKTWAVVAALRNGITLSDTFNGRTLLSATTTSNNDAFKELITSKRGLSDATIKAATDAGLPKNNSFQAVDTVALGFSEVSPINAAAGYATLANEGKQVKPFIVQEVRDAKGDNLYTKAVSTPQTIETDVANDTTYALTHVAQEGTGRAVGALAWPVAGKTGTRWVDRQTGTTASWFVGYTKQISTAVMYVTGDDGAGNLDTYAPGFYGSGYPAQTWLSYMKVAMQGLPKVNFPSPTKRVSTAQPTADDSVDPNADPTDAPPPDPKPTKTAPTQAPTTSAPPAQPSQPPQQPPVASPGQVKPQATTKG